jgi:hypothetical protein
MAKSKDVPKSMESMPLFVYSTSRQLSGNTVERYRTPTNPHTAKAITQYVIDYSQQKNIVPNNTKNGGCIVEATQIEQRDTRTMNKNGKTTALGALSKAFLGSSPDEPGIY